ncbi:hypothetical protein ASPVEDRAFT_150782 [Aspergillus versicolor CBS 583.65]|uniref:Uncharacterized protein n=1 Tax=Aspergillus versicolor CBS 583.65 TaxID=1036611 RepID=A0A1L9PKX1_ASPVE|nr:uncharacterized protein ASPVEDRAFT_150782 [Aspergillus versicolor CBS 583.65]OJJ02075.1 hypothetical protein ASPVEDRAFT_150782 [Aspergillus versicolor CBS 583.65]
MPDSTLLKVAGYGSIIVSLLHAASGRKFQRLREFQTLPDVAYTFSMSAWYQGSGYLILAGLLNFQWAQDPSLLEQPLGRAMASVLSVIAWSASGWYLFRGLTVDGVIIAAAGLFQAWAALK